MNNITAFDNSFLAKGLKEAGESTTAFVKQLSQFATLDLKTGSCSFTESEVNKLAKSSLAKDMINPFSTSMNNIARGGMAVFGNEKEIAAGKAMAIPWIVISDIIYKFEGTPILIREALGISKASSEDEAVEIIKNKFSNFPKWMIDGGITKLLLKNPIGLPRPGSGGGRGGDEPPPRPKDQPIKPKIPGSGFTLPILDDIIELGKCFANASFGPYLNLYVGRAPIGYLFGFQVCLGHDCADKLSKVLQGTGGGAAAAEVLEKVISEGLNAAIKAFSFSAGIALAIYGYALGLNIKLVNGTNGVCLQFNWPIIGGPGMLIYAVPR
jgi:hypothetical protein